MLGKLLGSSRLRRDSSNILGISTNLLESSFLDIEINFL